MRYRRIDVPWGINPGPEEIAIDTWLDNPEPYVSLREPGDGGRTRRAPAARSRPAPPATLEPRS